MDIKTFESIAHKLPPEIAILMRGPTGVGKSHLAAAVAEKLQLELIDVRGSTMSEGDTGGYPDIEGMKKNGKCSINKKKRAAVESARRSAS